MFFPSTVNLNAIGTRFVIFMLKLMIIIIANTKYFNYFLFSFMFLAFTARMKANFKYNHIGYMESYFSAKRNKRHVRVRDGFRIILEPREIDGSAKMIVSIEKQMEPGSTFSPNKYAESYAIIELSNSVHRFPLNVNDEAELSIFDSALNAFSDRKKIRLSVMFKYVTPEVFWRHYKPDQLGN